MSDYLRRNFLNNEIIIRRKNAKTKNIQEKAKASSQAENSDKDKEAEGRQAKEAQDAKQNSAPRAGKKERQKSQP